MLQATDALPMNFGFLGKGNTSRAGGLEEQIRAGAIGLKLHEDWGSTPAAIDCCLTEADQFDVQVAIHTDTLNESGYVDDSIAAFKGRTIHTYHTEGAGGGHAPDIIRVCGEPNVLPSSTNPTRPYTVNTLDEHLDMLMVCHHLDREHPRGRGVRREPDSRRDDRRRGRAARPRRDQHDVERQPGDGARRRGHLAAPGRPRTRCAASAARCRAKRGDNDNLRIRRYIAKYTINPAITHGIADEVGSVEVGKLADLVLWKPAFFGVKPELVIKGGFIAWAQMGDPNASIPTPQPVLMRPMFGAYGRATGATSLAFVSQLALEAGTIAGYGLTKRPSAVRGCRTVDQARHEAERRAAADPRRRRNLHRAPPTAKSCGRRRPHVLPLAQRYFLF